MVLRQAERDGVGGGGGGVRRRRKLVCEYGGVGPIGDGTPQWFQWVLGRFQWVMVWLLSVVNSSCDYIC